MSRIVTYVKTLSKFDLAAEDRNLKSWKFYQKSKFWLKEYDFVLLQITFSGDWLFSRYDYHKTKCFLSKLKKVQKMFLSKNFDQNQIRQQGVTLTRLSSEKLLTPSDFGGRFVIFQKLTPGGPIGRVSIFAKNCYFCQSFDFYENLKI